ncbi:MAG: HPr kinase/phosphorylase [Oxalobacter sp.]|nr:HPr kinase/phosphorylase [Oxalobacter sp.]
MANETSLTIQRLYASNRDQLQLTWFAGLDGGNKQIMATATSAADLVGHFNMIHPMRVHVLGVREIEYYERLDPVQQAVLVQEISDGNPPALIIARGLDVPANIRNICNNEDIPLFTTPLTAAEVIDFLRVYLARQFAPTVIMHGVFMDVLGVGVLVTGESGLGKSELGLELISRNHGLVADDAVEFSRTAPNVIEGRAPELLRNLMEVRGLGVLDIRGIFGEAAVRRTMRLTLIVHLIRSSTAGDDLDRFPLGQQTEDVLGLPIRKVTIPIAAGRNIAVLVEAAVRNTIMQLRGFDTMQEFMDRQRKAMTKS